MWVDCVCVWEKKIVAKIASFGEKLNILHFAICYLLCIQSYSIVLRRFNNPIYFPNNFKPMLIQTVELFAHTVNSGCKTLSIAWSLEPFTRFHSPYTQCYSRIISFCSFFIYLSLVRANIKVATPESHKHNNRTAKTMKICTYEWSIKWH